MTPQALEILQSARVAELRAAAETIAVLTRSRPALVLPRAPKAQRRCLLMLLRWERQRNVKLVAELLKHG